MAKEHHVVPNKEKGWCVKTDNAERASACFEKKQIKWVKWDRLLYLK